MSTLDNLLNLFKVDAQVRGLRSRVAGAERFLNAQQRKLDEVQEEKAELESRRKQHRAKIANLEAEVGVVDARIEKHRKELNNASTNKEYTALLSEVNTFKAEKAELETQILAEMESVETINHDLERLEAEFAERCAKRDQAHKERDARLADVRERLEELERERAVAATNIPPDELEIFNELAETYDGEALSSIEVIDRRNREYACAACNMHVPFETVSRLLSGGGALVRCNVCHRILYLQEEMRGTLVSKK